MSNEKVYTLKALGAVVKRTPTNAPCVPGPGYEQSHIAKAIAIRDDLNRDMSGPRAHILDQYSNPSNPLAHIEGTAMEIYRQCDGKLDMIVLTAGTGGTIAGVAKRLKQLIPDIIVVGVDPHGSILAVEGKNKVSLYSGACAHNAANHHMPAVSLFLFGAALLLMFSLFVCSF